MGRRVMDLACTTAEELEYVDLYSCFPSAVQVAAKELGLSEDRPLDSDGRFDLWRRTLNNYVMHSVARTVELLRANPGKKGLVTANGGNLYSTCIVSMVLSLLHRISNLRTCNKRLMLSLQECAWLTIKVRLRSNLIRSVRWGESNGGSLRLSDTRRRSCLGEQSGYRRDARYDAGRILRSIGDYFVRRFGYFVLLEFLDEQ